MRTKILDGEMHCTQMSPPFPYDAPPEAVEAIRQRLIAGSSEKYSRLVLTEPVAQIVGGQYVMFAVGIKRRSRLLYWVRWRLRSLFTKNRSVR